jgi:hypothetical protein
MTTARTLGPGGPRQHHFIPRWFLENFTEDGKIARIRLGGRKPPVITTVKNVAVERDLYTVTLPETGKTSMVEDELAVIDGDAAKPVRQLVTTGDIHLSGEERQAVLTWIASLWVRGPRWRRQQEAFADLAIKIEIDKAPDISAVQRILVERLDRDVSLDEAEEIKRKMASGGVEFASIGSDITMTMLERIRQGAVDLRYYRWEVVRNLPSQLVLPDMPVVVQPVLRTSPPELQLRSWAAIQLPLSPRVLLSLLPPATADFGPRHYLDPLLLQLRHEIANWSFMELYCAPSAANEAAVFVAGRDIPPLMVTGDETSTIDFDVDGLDGSPLRPRHRRVSWAMAQAAPRLDPN